MKYGNVPVHAQVGDRTYHFKSKLEYRWAQHLELLKVGGLIKDWFYEFHTFYFEGKPSEYTPDFLVRNNDNTFEYYETKGWVQKFDLDKIKRIWDEREDVKITVVFWQKPSKKSLSIQKRDKLICYTKNNVIWDAKKRIGGEPIDLS
jgi:hypothetical protein